MTPNQTVPANPFPNYKPRPGGAEYKSVDTSTPEGLKRAERLHRSGWATSQTGLYRIQFWRPRNPEER